MQWQRGCTWRFTWLTYEHVSAVEGVLDGSSEGTPTFKVEIKGAFEHKIAVHLLVRKSSQNNSMKGELEEAPYVALEDAPKISL